MINSLIGWKDRKELQNLVKYHPEKVWLEGKYIISGNHYNGYAEDISRDDTLMVKHGGKSYGFRKGMDGRVETF